MEVDKKHFNVHLLPILRHIANAEFVAFDLEMSGIGSSIKRDDKPNLQEVYEDVKAAAEKYQVLQVGITCIEKDEEHDMYIARPYNFNLSPLFIEKDRLGIERTFSFSSGAIQFLLGERVNFDIAAPFYTGVPYLSRDEEEEARHRFHNVVFNDVVISPTDSEALAFFRNSRQTIKKWVEEPESKTKLNYVNIALNGRYGVRLVHQLIRSEFPDLLARYMRDSEFMQITVKDEEREAQYAKSKLQILEKNLAKQTGLRFIFEALFGGDLSKIDPKWFSIDNEGNPTWKDPELKRAEIDSIIQALKVRRPALVGHNMNTDLAFMYKTFIGKLPETYQEFASKIHALCPIVIDTKYLATHNCGTMDTKSDLHGLLQQFNKQTYPFVVLAEKNSSYSNNYKTHEAGYDSWMTAEVLLKLASKLNADQESSERACQPHTTNTKENMSLPYHHRRSPSSTDSDSSNSQGGVSLLDTDNYDFNHLVNGKTYDRMSEEIPAPLQFIPPVAPFKKLRGPGEKVELGIGWHAMQLNGDKRNAPKSGLPNQWLPAWDSPFWREYVNRLRVFQAEEGFYILKDY